MPGTPCGRRPGRPRAAVEVGPCGPLAAARNGSCPATYASSSRGITAGGQTGPLALSCAPNRPWRPPQRRSAMVTPSLPASASAPAAPPLVGREREQATLRAPSPPRWPGAAHWSSSAGRRASARPPWPRRSPETPPPRRAGLVGALLRPDRDAALRPLARALRPRPARGPPRAAAAGGPGRRGAGGRHRPGGALRPGARRARGRGGAAAAAAAPGRPALGRPGQPRPAARPGPRRSARCPCCSGHLPRRRADAPPPALPAPPRPGARGRRRPASTCGRWTTAPSAPWSAPATPSPPPTRPGWWPTSGRGRRATPSSPGSCCARSRRAGCCARRAAARGPWATWPARACRRCCGRCSRGGWPGWARRRAPCWPWRRSSARRCRWRSGRRWRASRRATLLDAVERAAAAHLLAASPDGASVRFAHALVREALYEGVLPPRRRGWHRRVAEALLAGRAPDPDAVAYHFQRAGDPRAVAWLVAAGDRADRAYAWLTAAERSEAALALLDGSGGDAAERGWLCFRLARLRRYGDHRQALGYAERATALGAETATAPWRPTACPPWACSAATTASCAPGWRRWRPAQRRGRRSGPKRGRGPGAPAAAGVRAAAAARRVRPRHLAHRPRPLRRGGHAGRTPPRHHAGHSRSPPGPTSASRSAPWRPTSDARRRAPGGTPRRGRAAAPRATTGSWGSSRSRSCWPSTSPTAPTTRTSGRGWRRRRRRAGGGPAASCGRRRRWAWRTSRCWCWRGSGTPPGTWPWRRARAPG